MNRIIRNISIILTLLAFVINAHSQGSISERFDKGVTSFSSGNYTEALNIWTDIYNTGYLSANLDYNIGNAYFKLKDFPNAILFYERASLLNPADENITYNLQIARTLIVDRFQEIPELFFKKWFDFISLILSGNTWAKISIISFILCLGLLSLYLYSSKHKHKVLGFWLSIVFVATSLMSLSFSARNHKMIDKSDKAIITNPLVNGKSSPDTSGNDLFVLHEGTKVTIEDNVGEWLEIRLSDGNKGWVPSNSLKII
jgi:tetratricopeptide (TPR) repeat protein